MDFSLARWWKFRKHGIPFRISRMIRWNTIDVDGRKLRVLDCRPYTMGVTALTGDEKTAKTFVLSRNDDGRTFVDQHPDNPAVFRSDYIFPQESEIPSGPLFRARQMEDKYDIYHYDGVLLLVRSWTQTLSMRVSIERIADGTRLSEIEYDSLRYANDDFALQALEFLLKSHCLDMVAPHPLHPKLDPKSEVAILSYSFSEFGRRGWHGTFDNTVGVYSGKTYGFSDQETPDESTSS